MNRDQTEGKWRQIVGGVKKAWGRALGSRAKMAEGAATELGGVIQEKIGDIKQGVETEISKDRSK